ncbi:hypothetical protein ACFU0X_34895, partial [Streptomyces cellulosae]
MSGFTWRRVIAWFRPARVRARTAEGSIRTNSGVQSRPKTMYPRVPATRVSASGFFSGGYAGHRNAASLLASSPWSSAARAANA